MKDVQSWLGEELGRAAPDRHKVEFRTDAKTVATAWCRLDDPADLGPVAARLAAHAVRFAAISVFPGRIGGHELAWHFDLDGDNLTVFAELAASQPVVSLTAWFPAAEWAEREMAQCHGILPAGRPEPLFIGGDGPSGDYRPLSVWLDGATGRRSRPLRLTEPLFLAYREVAGRVHEPRLRLAPPHRRPAEGERNLHQLLALVERLCTHCGNSHAFAYCMALEQIGGLVPSGRADYLRVLADEIKRGAAHLYCLALTARRAGQEALGSDFLEAREILLAATEAMFGNRLTLAANRVGGVLVDPDPALLAWLGERIGDLLEDALPPLRRALAWGGGFARRTRGLGRISAEEARRLALVGPVARASGIDCDVRRKAPYALYDHLDFALAGHGEGDVWARSLVRLQEVEQSLAIMVQCLAGLAEQPSDPDRDWPEIPAGEAIAKCESPEGELHYYLRTDGSERPQRLKWRSATGNNWRALPGLLEGAAVGDLALIAGSLGPCIEG